MAGEGRQRPQPAHRHLVPGQSPQPVVARVAAIPQPKVV